MSKKNKKPGPKTVNTTVCVPRKLRKRMESFRANHPVNWSEIASEAWEQYMDDHDEDEEDDD